MQAAEYLSFEKRIILGQFEWGDVTTYNCPKKNTRIPRPFSVDLASITSIFVGLGTDETYITKKHHVLSFFSSFIFPLKRGLLYEDLRDSVIGNLLRTPQLKDK